MSLPEPFERRYKELFEKIRKEGIGVNTKRQRTLTWFLRLFEPYGRMVRVGKQKEEYVIEVYIEPVNLLVNLRKQQKGIRPSWRDSVQEGIDVMIGNKMIKPLNECRGPDYRFNFNDYVFDLRVWQNPAKLAHESFRHETAENQRPNDS